MVDPAVQVPCCCLVPSDAAGLIIGGPAETALTARGPGAVRGGGWQFC